MSEDKRSLREFLNEYNKIVYDFFNNLLDMQWERALEFLKELKKEDEKKE